MNNSSLHDEKTFYKLFIKDLQNSKKEVIIESPFITSSRMKLLFPILANIAYKGVKVFIITKNPLEHEGKYIQESEFEIQRFEHSGIQVFLCDGNHHRKLAILDRKILWEGSLNILSQIKSREIMRRIPGGNYAIQMIKFLKFDQFLTINSL